MAKFTRYDRTPKIAGLQQQTSYVAHLIKWNVTLGTITVKQMTSLPGQRLDILAGKFYGDSSLWWVIAAASGIGWGLQIPGGTVLTIPTDISQIAALVE